jgi:hypothetical protein
MSIPALFGHGLNDMFIQPHHCERIHEAYGVSVWVACFIKIEGHIDFTSTQQYGIASRLFLPKSILVIL